jgi:tetratricopeptide (TPR) repeat protein
MAQDKEDNRIEQNIPDSNVSDADNVDLTAANNSPVSTFNRDGELLKALESSLNHLKNHKSDYKKSHRGSNSGKKLFRIQIILLIGIIAIIVALFFRLFPGFDKQKTTRPAPTARYQPEPDAQNQNKPKQTNESESAQQESISLKFANDYFLQEHYTMAFQAYEKLDNALQENEHLQFMSDFLKLQKGMCLKKLGHLQEAERLFRAVCSGDSCSMKAMANYQWALIEFEREQYLEARKYASRAIALSEAVTADIDWALSLKKDCHFIIALALTRRAANLSDTNTNIPEKLWQIKPQQHLNFEMTHGELEELLKSGNAKLDNALMGPEIKRLQLDDTIEHFQIASNRAPAEELFAKFSSNVDINMFWQIDKNSSELRRLPVSIFLPDATTEEFATIAAGCIGLQAIIDSKSQPATLTITNPSDYSDLNKHLSTIRSEALQLWQKFIIKYHDDQRVPQAHFAGALIHATADNTVDAITQFKLIANRHGSSSLAPYALLNCSQLKTDLKDYAGAKDDLQELIQQYNQTDVAQKAYLYLAEAALKSGQYTEAEKGFRKVYNFDMSVESKTAACLGSAKSLYHIGDFASAEEWLDRYLTLTTPKNLNEPHKVYLLLGKVCLEQNKLLKAFNAFKSALSEKLTLKDRTDVIAALLKCEIEKLDPIQALDLLETLKSQGLSSEEQTKALLLKSAVLRRMCLPEKALAMLNDKIDYILNPQLRAKAYREAAECFFENGQPQKTYSYLTKSLTLTEPGIFCDQTMFRLAEISLQLGKDNQTITLCSQLLQRQISRDLRKNVLSILAEAYTRQNNYEEAIKLLAQQALESADSSEEKTVLETPQQEISLDEQVQRDS